MQRKRMSAPSRGWLAFFGLIAAVLLTVFSLALSFALTIGDANKVSAVLTTPQASATLTTALNRQLDGEARAAHLPIKQGSTPTWVTQTAVRQTTKAAVHRAADFNQSVDLQPLRQEMHTQLQHKMAASPQALSVTQKKRITQRFDAALERLINRDIMQQGWGAAYAILVLTLQTATIVAGILFVLVLAFMALASRSWRRWLLVVGRITYGIGLLGGAATLIVGIPGVVGHLTLASLPPQLLQALVTSFVPLWQRVAGTVILVGFVSAGLGRLVPRNDSVPA